MRYTDNLNLKKPEQTEFYDVDDFNGNADIIDAEIMKRLPLAGGTMTGTITQSAEVGINRPTNGGSLTLVGAKTWEDGAYVKLFGKEATSNKGEFVLRSSDGTTASHLFGKPNGGLIWNDKNIVRSVNNIPASDDGNVQITTVNNITVESIPIQQGKRIGELKTELLAWVKRTQGVMAQCMFTADNAWSEHWTDDSYVLKEGSLWTVTAIGNITTHVQAYSHLLFASYASPKVFTATIVENSFTTHFKMLGDVTSVNNILPDKNGNVNLPVATTEKYGLVRVAKPTDVLDTVDDAAITPAVYHDVSDFRHKQTAYNLGEKVECMFNHEMFLECTKAGTTSADPLDTRNVNHGQVLTDGTVQWTVRTHIKSVNGVVAGADGDVSVGLLNGDADTKGIKQFKCFSRSGENRSYWYLGSTPANTTGAEDTSAQIVSLRVSSVGDFGGRDLADYEVYITPRYATPSILAFSNKPMSEARTLKCGYVINGANVDWYIVSPAWTSPFYVSYLTAPDSPELSYPFNRPEKLTYVTQEPADFVYGEIIVASNPPTISAGTNGWARDSATGFTIQWGEVSLAAGTQTVTFPRTFKACYSVVSDVAGDISHYENPYISDITTQSFKHWHRYGTHLVTWIATGVS